MYKIERRFTRLSSHSSLTEASWLQLKRALKEGNDVAEDIFEFCASEKVEYLYLNQCSLAVVPESISRITSLKRLHLGYNQLTALPSSFNQLQHLEGLGIDGNSIKTFPLVICQMTSLKKLWLNGNKFASIPESIGNLVNLEGLYLHNCSISNLPVSFHKLTNLKELLANVNPLVFPPSSIIVDRKEQARKEQARKAIAYLKRYHDNRHRVTQKLSLQRNRDRLLYIETPERFSYTEHTPFAVMDDYLYQYFWKNFVFNECNDGDWPQRRKKKKKRRKKRERTEREEGKRRAAAESGSDLVSSASYSYDEDDQ